MKKVIIGGIIFTFIMVTWILAVYSQLPSQIPTHFNLNAIDSYGDRSHIFMYPMLFVGLNIMMIGLPYLDPKKKNYVKFNRTYLRIIWLMDIVMFIFFSCLLYSMFYPNNVNMNLFSQIFIGVLILCMGNMMPRIKQNYFIGIKTPWVLADERVWNKTHRISGRLWFGGGIFLIIRAFIPQFSLWIDVLVFVILVIIPLIYSFMLYKKLNKKGETL